ncbi:MAG: hypothetical protein KBC94_07820 [Pseudacidovorax sp.]|uniref:hypothetical protein n=1 Tax=Pseudacidovorax sp. TaxID=1934311 RepID=UPI001B4FCC42|nr:hypothetical protein [Pseudacidovorax sp.]MBP6894314.1 hypothetical protein [Pseudacidovorax sp.]
MGDAQTPLAFRYKNAAGEVSERVLTTWSEVGHYVEGFDQRAGKFCTFRKDRVVEYLDDAASLLATPRSSPPPKVRQATLKDERPQILFTGFAAVQRAHLEGLADAGGLRVVKTVTAALVFLCAGPTAGPAKVAKSRAQGVYIVREPELHSLIETGELPDYALDGVV